MESGLSNGRLDARARADEPGVEWCFDDRRDAGRLLGAQLRVQLDPEIAATTVVVGIAGGGAVVAAEVARSLDAPLAVVTARDPDAPIDAATRVRAGAGADARDGASMECVVAALSRVDTEAEALDRKRHRAVSCDEFRGATVIVVDDGVITGASMIAAVRWSRARGAGGVVAAVPIAAFTGLARVSAEADEVVWGDVRERLQAVGDWYEDFPPVRVDEEIRLLEEARPTFYGRPRKTIRLARRKRPPGTHPPHASLGADALAQ
jgi:predicted phosphoribosyltransferase